MHEQHPTKDYLLHVLRRKILLLANLPPPSPREWAGWLRAPLDGAARVGNFPLVEFLLHAGAATGSDHNSSSNCSSVSDGRNMVASAAFGGNPDVVRAVIQAAGSSNINKRDSVTGEYPLHIASSRGHRAAVDVLLRFGADVNVKLIVDTGLKKSCSYWGRTLLQEGMTALHWAALGGHFEIIEDLITRGADMDARVSQSGESALHLASRRGHEASVVVLLDAGAAPAVLSRSNLSPMDLAACHDHPGTVREFLFRGIDPNNKNTKGFTALHQAAYHNAGRAMEALIELGGSLSVATDKGFTPLHVAAFSSHSSSSISIDSSKNEEGEGTCSALRIIGRYAGDFLEVDATDAYGSTPLRTACMYLREDAVQGLLRMGADEKLVNLSLESYVVQGASRDSLKDSAAGTRSERISRVMGMLAAAMADRAWRRRGWLIMLRARFSSGRFCDDSWARASALKGFAKIPCELSGSEGKRRSVRQRRPTVKGAIHTSPAESRFVHEKPAVLGEAVVRAMQVQERSIFRKIALFL